MRLVHNNLLDKIDETNQQQLDQLQAAVDRGDLQPPNEANAVCGYDFRGRIVCYPASPSPRNGFEAAEREVGSIKLVAQQSTASVNRTVDSVTDVLLLVVPLMIALVALAAWYFTGRALKPVEAIRLEAESITATTMHRRLPEPETDDEVGRLARTMNAMLTRLETSAQKQRQFVSDASHELRSPLASIRTNLEVALHNPERADWPSVAQRALAEDVRMEDTVSELLDLARLDETEGPVLLATLPEVDVDELVLDDTVQQRRVQVDTGARVGRPRARPSRSAAARGAQPPRQRRPARQVGRGRRAAHDRRHRRAHRRRRRTRHPGRGPRAGVRTVHPSR